MLIILILWCARKAPRLTLYMLITFCCFYFYTGIIESQYQSDFSGEEKVLNGEIHTIPVIDGSKMTFEYHTANEDVIVNYQISSENEKETLKTLSVGSICVLSGALEAPTESGTSSQFNYQRYLKHKRIFWVYHLNKPPQCKPPTSFGIKQIRQKVFFDIRDHYPDELKGIAASLLIGERNLMDSEVGTAYRELGLSHVLAVSGLHVGVICGISFWILIRLGVTRQRSYELLFIGCPFYMVFAGAAPSVVRATFMMMIIFALLRLRIMPNPLDGISVACFLIVVHNPFVVYHIGFQLSFLISFALIISSSHLLKRFTTPFSQLFSVSMIAQVISLPLVLYHFYEISPLSLPLNILYVPVISAFILPAIFILAILRFLHLTSLFYVCTAILSFVVDFIHTLLVWLNHFHFTLVFGSPSTIVLLLLFGTSYTVLLLWEKNKFVNGMTLWVLVMFVLYMLPNVNPYGKVTFLDVGQGDCIVITLPFQRQVIVIDTGGVPVFGEVEDWEEKKDPFDIGADFVVPYLKSNGIRSIDILLLTHGDFDHVGGAKGILSEVPVKNVIVDRSDEQTSTEKEVIFFAKEKGGNIVKAKPGISWRSGEALFSILQVMDTKEENDGSIVLFANLGEHRWLFMGDLEGGGEKELLKLELKADVLKVGHHGSDTSTSDELIKAVDPDIAIISAGKNNRYGHPDLGVVERLKESGAIVMRTDENGSITYTYHDQWGGEWNVHRNEK
ncbi:DNA internalization-related competence protein ComEC/Rec2 [Guptibacillus algicola]|uniref:DNA internalization-related competence protein ComEC/Rec2 n=1 Tax=Guptibacillus algicola TaxID=225844 RepID=UPI001CD277BD|nr:DNA internalization-related competence protein ComEC/Rec2 [Alkalihalobacillus algicola]MCA0986111.1 DNA internalization-related competence protein ComEC/Rec2 [Alkalihalobacillus algicola]